VATHLEEKWLIWTIVTTQLFRVSDNWGKNLQPKRSLLLCPGKILWFAATCLFYKMSLTHIKVVLIATNSRSQF
jgi:hypothetical protein